MDTHAYPGKGLSLSQLTFALNEELKRVAYRSSFTFDAVSRLDENTSIALATIREWRNSFVPINRIPSEVLSLIPTYLPCEKDLSNASSVCRHWRRTFIQHATLWSQLDLTTRRDNLFMLKTLLERAKGTPLDIRSTRLHRADILALLSPHSQQLRTLEFVYDRWSDIQRFSEAVSGPLPLLHTLKIGVVGYDIPRPEAMNLPLFSGAVNLKEFILHPEGELLLDYFAFPNLTTFQLSATPDDGEFPVSQLLNFLEASPTLQTVLIRIGAAISLEDIPPGRVIILPNVETFSLTQDDPDYGIAARISFPSARLTSFVHEQEVEDVISVFPTSVSWNAIGPQHTERPIDEVVLRITTAGDAVVACSLSFLSPGPATFELGYRMIADYEGHRETPRSLGEKHSEVISQAFEAIRNHPLLGNVKRLRIWDRHRLLAPNRLAHIAYQAVRLLKSTGPLEELTLNVADLRPYLAPFLDMPEFRDIERPVAFPFVEELMISRSLIPHDEECMAAIAEFAKSQHALGVPFKRTILRMKDSPVMMRMVERLEPWVGTVDFDEDIIIDGRNLM